MEPADTEGRLPPWRAPLAAALACGRSVPESRYLQLASIGLDRRPRNRTVVFRGFGPASELLILSDSRSAKCRELSLQPRAELCWYLPVTREQFRLQVQIALHGGEAVAPWSAVRQRLWDERGAAGQAEWLLHVPSAPLPAPVAEFILLAALVDDAEHLDLRQTPHAYTRHWRAPTGWERQ